MSMSFSIVRRPFALADFCPARNVSPRAIRKTRTIVTRTLFMDFLLRNRMPAILARHILRLIRDESETDGITAPVSMIWEWLFTTVGNGAKVVLSLAGLVV